MLHHSTITPDTRVRGSAILPWLVLACVSATARGGEEGVRRIPDLHYATASDVKLHLDLYLPEKQAHRPLVVYIHGGSWRAGDRTRCPVTWLTDRGYPLASIQYRLSQQAVFPAQLHDCRAAIRWLRAHAEQYGYDAQRIVAIGSSAGGHLAALLGVSGDVEALQGTVGDHLNQSSSVQAVVDYYGASDFVLRSKTQPQNTEQPAGNVYQLLGGPVSRNLDKARLASSVTHVGTDAPPLLIIHGLLDRKVNVQQSVQLYQAYRAKQLPVTIRLVRDAGHGGNVFYTGENREAVLRFLETHFDAEHQ